MKNKAHYSHEKQTSLLAVIALTVALQNRERQDISYLILNQVKNLYNKGNDIK